MNKIVISDISLNLLKDFVVDLEMVSPSDKVWISTLICIIIRNKIWALLKDGKPLFVQPESIIKNLTDFFCFLFTYINTHSLDYPKCLQKATALGLLKTFHCTHLMPRSVISHSLIVSPCYRRDVIKLINFILHYSLFALSFKYCNNQISSFYGTNILLYV